ncbi:Sma2p KNAG_0E04010 [Huiozyma naganishii CBS 8797]|uniref:Uncharacterized protein n=1 Tax=Huiozyma naganishii (strain ATCC MYA-139 / BCRC 22969 / CBS 8797 / KCTC 17520 / NBRC 10181 / NCYC 3082 / Yp74L-3) TaxID=1071383 RepID=J7S6X8_HUIN7|nr:hypothetical protein KNAG_0E04010 [Kazachstania naganishii CBS 8797]CCK70654.1 hypothetical protein KNAG_0E04010 [Kazachstania naganishii CBS 8797]
MVPFKNTICWLIIICGFLTQLLLYIPSFTCTNDKALPICMPQFSFEVVKDSRLSSGLTLGFREFLGALSYFAYNMGWSSSHSKENDKIYEWEELIDTFDPGNRYYANYGGFCKYNGSRKVACFSNNGYGPNVFAILAQDFGIQLGNLSLSNSNSSLTFGSQFTYSFMSIVKHLKRYISTHWFDDSVISSLVPMYKKIQEDLLHFNNVIIIIAWFLKFNKIVFIVFLLEFVASIACTLWFLCSFGVIKICRYKGAYANPGSVYIIIIFMAFTTASFILSICLQGTLGILNQDPNNFQNDKFTLIQAKVGSGFIITCVRYAMQVSVVIITAALLCLNIPKRKKKKRQASDEISEYEEANGKMFDTTLPPVEFTVDEEGNDTFGV